MRGPEMDRRELFQKIRSDIEALWQAAEAIRGLRTFKQILCHTEDARGVTTHDPAATALAGIRDLAEALWFELVGEIPTDDFPEVGALINHELFRI